MSRRWRPPHPARTIHPTPCPTGQPRFATLKLARTALLAGMSDHRIEAHPCQHCGGAHHHETEQP
jgi:hypothetical protein